MIAERRAIAYEPQFDQGIGLKASYLSRQIDTFLGERLNVLLSKNKYEIKNGLIYGQDIDEPFVEVMKRGVDYRQKAEGANRADKKREEAEIEGFLKTQEVMCNSNTTIGTMILSVSPQGGKDSLYQHNFYDIFTLKEENGTKFIEARRYSSALSIGEYKDKLSTLSFMGNVLDVADFLKHPIKINNLFFENADQIHSYLHNNHEFIALKDFQRVIRACEQLKREYYLTRDPRILNAIMNKADEEVGLVDLKPMMKSLTIDQEINFYGQQPVRIAATGCGSSGSASKLNEELSPFSVSEFGLSGESINYEFDQDGPCKKCNAISVKCGPCGICRACDLAIRASQKFGSN